VRVDATLLAERSSEIGIMGLGCAGWSSPPAPFDRLRLRPEAQPEGAGLSSEAGEPALSLSKRGDQRRTQGRSSAAYATLARMCCPPLNPPAEERWGNGGFPISHREGVGRATPSQPFCASFLISPQSSSGTGGVCCFFGSGASTISASVVRIIPATLIAFSSAVRTTLAGSMIPAAIRSTYAPVITS